MIFHNDDDDDDMHKYYAANDDDTIIDGFLLEFFILDTSINIMSTFFFPCIFLSHYVV